MEKCKDYSTCEKYKEYKLKNCSHCLECSKPIKETENTKEADSKEEGFFKHGSEDL